MAYKPKRIKTTIGAAVGDAFSTIEELGAEMRETYDNMESANMGHMSKCEMAGEAADELENHSEPDVPGILAEIEIESDEMVNKDKRKGLSRSVRLDNALALLRDTIAKLEAIVDESTPEEGEPTQEQADLSEAAETLKLDLEEPSEISVEFPGMYG